ncbi:MAG: helix-turn-helix domain-containing protein [Chloroflexi bacterium]|nr:helix-turn-helix domain-containing protein [Chloroflexota bacterium]
MRRILRNRVAELVAIKARRENRTIYKTTITDETGLSKRTVDMWMANQVTRFDDNVLLTWSDYLGCGIGDLFIIEYEDPETKTHPDERLLDIA